MRWPQTLRARLTMWYTLVLGAPLVAFAGASFLVLDRALLHRADGFLDETLGAFTTELQSEQQEESSVAAAIRASLKDVHFRDVRLAVFDSSGRLVAAATLDSTAGYALRHPVSLPDVGAALRARPIDERHAFTLGAGESAYRVTSESSVIFGTRFRVIAAYPLHGNRETMEAVGTAQSQPPSGSALAP